MPQTLQPAQHVLAEFRLDGQAPVTFVRPVRPLALLRRRPARRLQCGLRIGAEVHHRGQHLEIDLHLVVGAWRALHRP